MGPCFYLQRCDLAYIRGWGGNDLQSVGQNNLAPAHMDWVASVVCQWLGAFLAPAPLLLLSSPLLSARGAGTVSS